MVIKLNIVRLNCASLNHASLNGVGERLRASAGGGGGEVIPPDIPVTYTLSASVENGSVKATVNGVAVTLPYTANEGEVVVVEVTANDGYEFDGWSDGNKSNPRTIIVNEDITLNASCKEVFVPLPTYTLSASVVNGVISATLNGKAISLPYETNEGDVIVLSVTPNDGYAFDGWNDGNTDNPRTITMNADVALSAQCVEVVAPSKYIQFEDAEVERVLMSKGVSSDGVGITIEDAEKVTSISTWFKNNKSILAFTELRFFTNVKTLVDNAFLACSSLKNVDLTNIETMGVRVFGDGGDLSEYDVDMPNLKTLSEGQWNQLFSKTNIRSIVNLGTITKLESYGANASCFDHCVNLQSAYLPNTLTEIGPGTFAFCSALTNVYIPSSVVTIEADAFAQCKALEELDIPQSIQSIGENAFGFDDNLQKLIVRASVPPSLANYAFQGCPLITIYVPDASLEAYKGATNWVSFADRIHPLSEIEGSLVFYDKLVGDGTAYINTEYYAKGLDSFAWDAEPPTSYNKFLFGCKNTKLNLGALTYAANQTYYLVGSTTTKLINGNNSARITRQMVVVSEDGAYKRKLIEGGNVVAELGSVGSYASAVSTTPLLVYACQKSATDTSADRIYNGAIRSFSITDIDGNTIMSLKPCTFAGEAGMWDEVGNKFYGNAATSGEFSVAND